MAEKTGLLVGDGIAPYDGGWPGGQPNAGPFTPYLVIVIRPSSSTEILGDTYGELILNWSFTSVGGNRKQAAWTADRSRWFVTELNLERFDIGDSYWRINLVRFAGLGGLQRIDQTDPPYWQCQDFVAFNLTRMKEKGSAIIS
jgi:hypothetical protein